MSKSPKARVGKTIASSAQNLFGPAAAFAMQFGTLPAVWGLAIAGGAGLLAVYRELAEDRGRELLSFVEEHQDEFLEQIVNSPEFVALFINIWEKHVRETAAAKRARLRNFLLAVGSGNYVPLDTHTKIYAIIDQMTDQEAAIFGVLIRGSNRPQFRRMNINSTSFSGLSPYSEDELRDVWHSLHAYRLVDITDAEVGHGMSLRQITPFGELFYDYVLEATEE